MTTTILAAIGAAVLILNAATRLPAALAELLRSLHLVRDALRELRSPSSNSAGRPAERRPPVGDQIEAGVHVAPGLPAVQTCGPQQLDRSGVELGQHVDQLRRRD
jgi:hypothetical protein